MDVYKLYAASTTSTDGAASLDIQSDGHIVAISHRMAMLGADALDDGGSSELSFGSTSGFATNDTKASLSLVRAFQGFLTTGGSAVIDKYEMSGLAIEVAAGERLFLHNQVSGTATLRATCYVFVMPLGDSAVRPAARRR